MRKYLIKEIYLPIIYIIVGIIVYQIVKTIIKRIFNIDKKVISNKKIDKKKVKTLEQLIINIFRILIITLVILSILPIFGIDVKTYLAGLGVIGVVIGLALQDVLKDFIVGFSLIMENYFSVGDTIEVNGFKGKVTYLGIRTTKIQQYSGPMLIIPNRNIQEVINYTNTYSQAIVDVGVAYESDFDKVEQTLTKLSEKLTKELKDIIGDVEVLGIERKIRKAILDAFEKEKIKIPYTQIEVHNGK